MVGAARRVMARSRDVPTPMTPRKLCHSTRRVCLPVLLASRRSTAYDTTSDMSTSDLRKLIFLTACYRYKSILQLMAPITFARDHRSHALCISLQAIN